MKRLIYPILTIIILAATSFKPGSANAILEGTSDSGRTKFYIEIQDLDGLVSNASLSVDGAGIIFLDDDGSVIFDDNNGVLTFTLEDGGAGDNPKILKFWSIPNTFRTVKNQENDKLYKFKAYIISSDPRENGAVTPQIKLNCKLTYSI